MILIPGLALRSRAPDKTRWTSGTCCSMEIPTPSTSNQSDCSASDSSWALGACAAWTRQPASRKNSATIRLPKLCCEAALTNKSRLDAP